MRDERRTPGWAVVFAGCAHLRRVRAYQQRTRCLSRSDEDYRTPKEYTTVWSVCAKVASVWDLGSVYLAVARPRQAQMRDETVDVLLRSQVPLLGKVVCLDSRKRVLIRPLLSKNSSPRHVSRRCQRRRVRRKQIDEHVNRTPSLLV